MAEAARATTRLLAPWGGLALTICLALAPAPGEAQGLLEFLFGPDPTARPAYPRPRESAPARRARAHGAVGELRFAPPKDGPVGGNGFSTDPTVGGFCVRTCDGYFFPLIKSTRATRQQSCELACPAAQMDVFDGPTIETARNRKGQRYSAMPHAFAFRDKAVGACACNDPQTSQSYFERTARRDPTLQSGDVIVETRGAFVYRGSKLVPLSNASFMSSALRDRLRAMLRRSGSTTPAEVVTQRPASKVEISTEDRTGSTPAAARQ
ncbi:MAG: DUF2865 domain-containing protein [Methylocystis sp.]|uniref:DUF2865 domain-containing protein n=1 Tax=Methylocystis sp. TaxID=1911079 RepID=UPI003DA40C17